MVGVNEVRLSGRGFGFRFKRRAVDRMPVSFYLPDEEVPEVEATFELALLGPHPDQEPCMRVGAYRLSRPRRDRKEMALRLQPTLLCHAYGHVALWLQANVQGATPLLVEGALMNRIHLPRRRQRNALATAVTDGISCVLATRIEILSDPPITRRGRVSLEPVVFDRMVEVLQAEAPDFALLPVLQRYARRVVEPNGQENER